MDYEFRILILEKETKHLREMQELVRSRVDAHDGSLNSIETLLRATNESLNRLTVNVEAISLKVDQLVSALLRDHPNGHGEG